MPTSSPPNSSAGSPALSSRSRAAEPRRTTLPPPPAPDPPGPDPSVGIVHAFTISPEDARDQALVLLATRGDQEALTELLTLHQDRVFAICLRMTCDRDAAEDLAQETLLRVIKNLNQFNHRARFTTWLTRVAMNVCLSHFRRGKLRRTVSLDAMPDPGASGTGMFASGVFRALTALGNDSIFSTWIGRVLGTSVPVLSDSSRSGSRSAEGIRGSPAARRFAPRTDRHRSAEDRAELSESLQILASALERIDPEQRALLILRDMHALDYQHIAEILDVPQGTVKSRLFRARAALREQYEIVLAKSP